ncbi:hypothetical protein [Ideonella dechloratans]|uniref:hypothetical protein n=1 Tax=Ideonella dechloratans TaxID=36863 RepID=UPI0035B42A9D
MKRLAITAKGAAERWVGWEVASVCLLCLTGAACSPSAESDSTASAHAEGQVVYFDVGLKSYLERPIFDVLVGRQDIGLAGGQPHGGPGGLMTGVPMRVGPQTVTWRLDGPKGTPGNGDTVTAVNRPMLTPDMAKHRYLGVHIYPDNTVELVPEDGWPEQTARGEEINRQWKASHGQ